MRGFTTADRTALSAQKPEPLYHQLFLVLKHKIDSGDLRHAARLPGELELAEFFGVSRITTRRALDELQSANYVRRQRGLGTYVTHEGSAERLSAPLTSMIDSLALIGRETSIRLVDFARVLPPAQIAQALKLRPGEAADRAIRVRTSGGLPFAHYVSWTIPLGALFSGENLRHSSRLDLFRRLGIELSEVDQVISAVAADATIAAQLEVAIGTPLLCVTRITSDQRGRPFDYLTALYRPDRFQYHLHLSSRDTTVRGRR